MQPSYRSANVEDGACLDVVAEGFLGKLILMLRLSTLWLLLIVLLHSLSVTVRKDECMKNVFER